ncbi:MAG: phosphoribosylamine--glycine ligase [Candidatus Edwardsbacteria bacterium]
MKVLVVGSGGREHALIWKINQSEKVSKIYAAPGNPGIAKLAECVNIQALAIEDLANFANKEKIDLTVVGPESPLIAGITDEFEKRGLRIFGPNKKAAALEGSKAFAKELMHRYKVPTADYQIFSDFEKASQYVKNCPFSFVIKADGEAAGKGAIIPKDKEEAISILQNMMIEKIFGPSGEKVVIEQKLEGEEISLLAFTDGETVLPMIPSQDHKRVFDYNQGPNTGGMGAYAPVPFINAEMVERMKREILVPVIKGLKGEGIKYKGVIYAGLILTKDGPKVLEFNCRFGDPETQAILPLLQTDLVDLLLATLEERLNEINFFWYEGFCVCVVLASKGYPGKYKKGKVIKGMEEAEKEALLFHAGTSFLSTPAAYCSLPTVVTGGGRVLGVTALGDTLKEARDKTYQAVAKIQFEGMHYRRDIGEKYE